jgi:hypothetical protein
MTSSALSRLDLLVFLLGFRGGSGVGFEARVALEEGGILSSSSDSCELVYSCFFALSFMLENR